MGFIVAPKLIAGPNSQAIETEVLLTAIESIEMQELSAGRIISETRRAFPYGLKKKPLEGIYVDAFLRRLLVELAKTQNPIRIDNSFIKTLLSLRPYLLDDLAIPIYVGRDVYNPTNSKKYLWKRVGFEHYFSEFLFEKSVQDLPLNVVSYLYPPSLKVKNPEKIPAWWSAVLDAYDVAVMEGANYGTLFDKLENIFQEHQITPTPELLRGWVARVIGLTRAENSMLLAALVNSLIAGPGGVVRICASHLCKQNAGELTPGKSFSQLKAMGVSAQIVTACFEGCRAGRHLVGDGFPKVDGAGMPIDMAPGVRDVLRSPGHFVPPGALCKSVLAQLRTQRVR